MVERSVEVRFGWTVFWLSTLPFLILSCLFLKRRHLHPIKERRPLVVLAGLSLLYLLNLLLVGEHVWALPCGLVVWGGYMLPFMAFPVYIFRAIYLLFLANFTNDAQLALSSTQRDSFGLLQLTPLSWFTTHRYLLKSKSLGAIFITIFVLHNIYLGPYMASFPAGTWSRVRFPDIMVHDFVRIAVLLLYFLIVFVIAFLLRKFPKDTFNIWRELKFMGAWAFICIVFWRSASTWSDKFDALPFWGNYWIASIHWFGQIVSLVWPLYLSYQSEAIPRTNTLSMDKILSEYYQEFSNFLFSEYAGEYLLFFRDINEYKQMANDDRIEVKTKAAQEIYQRYFHPHSPFPIPLSAATQHNVTQEVQQNAVGSSRTPIVYKEDNVELLVPSPMTSSAAGYPFEQSEEEVLSLLKDYYAPRWLSWMEATSRNRI